MKKKYLNAMALMVGMLATSGSVVHAGLFDFLAPKASWQNCNVNTCSIGGSTNVTSSYAKPNIQFYWLTEWLVFLR